MWPSTRHDSIPLAPPLCCCVCRQLRTAWQEWRQVSKQWCSIAAVAASLGEQDLGPAACCPACAAVPLEADVETGKGPSCTTSNVMLSTRSSPQPATARAASASPLPQVHGRILTMWHVAVCAELPCSLREHSAYTVLKDGNGQPDEAAIAAAQQKGLLPGNALVGSCMPNACTTWHDCCWALLSTWLPFVLQKLSAAV